MDNKIIDYKCCVCGRSNVKLWRMYCSTPSEFKCIQEFKPEDIKDFMDGKTCQIGWNVPAILDDSNTNVMGYTSCSENQCTRWYSLPL